MNKQELVTKFLEHGLLLTPETMNVLKEQDAESIINLAKSTNTLIVKSTKQDQTNEKPNLTFKIKKQTKKQKITPKDFVEYYNKKYEALKNILIQKLDAVSINNLQQDKEVCIIGMVGTKTTKGFYIEDQTNRVETICNENIQQNTTLGLKGVLKEKAFFVKEIIYPDVPLTKQTKQLTFPLTLTTKETNTTNTTISPNIKETKENLISNFDLPTTITIETNKHQLNILIFQPPTPLTKQSTQQLLKLRCLPENNLPNQNNIIEDIPDIFWIIQPEEWKENYKGVLIVSGECVEL